MPNTQKGFTMFSIKSFADVILVSKTFGRGALDHAVAHCTLSSEQNQIIRNCIRWAGNRIVTLEQVNDGNREYTVDAVFQVDKWCGEYVTWMKDVTIIRLGFASFAGPIGEALKQGIITKEQIEKLSKEITERNEAAKWLNL